MIITSIPTTVDQLPADELARCHIERVVLPLNALDRRVQRVTSDHGTELGLRLEPGTVLHAGDVLLRNEDNLVVVEVETADVLVIAPNSIVEMGQVAHALGNRHLQAQFFGPEEQFDGLEQHEGVMVIQYDHTAEHHLQHVGVPYVRTQHVMSEPFRHAEHTH